MMTPPRYDYAAVPMNADARRVADNWDPAADEAGGQQCKVYGAAVRDAACPAASGSAGPTTTR